ncbi:hypothetical protein [Clostridium drakei]|uniref:Uncharacterized protein n=1 Tax=Clostridium drakei TaxID=332101 RepID=A0A2U8DVW9_9CLOT|nr:hypothetical protein [Clostridium drakei]AWI06780.1 hypothetical protein B9W14_20530 [Clostridium drakei]
MEMKDFILNGDILSLQVKINEDNYRFSVRWKVPQKPYDETWKLEGYINVVTGEKDLTEEQVNKFIDTINARWNWNVKV